MGAALVFVAVVLTVQAAILWLGYRWSKPKTDVHAIEVDRDDNWWLTGPNGERLAKTAAHMTGRAEDGFPHCDRCKDGALLHCMDPCSCVCSVT